MNFARVLQCTAIRWQTHPWAGSRLSLETEPAHNRQDFDWLATRTERCVDLESAERVDYWWVLYCMPRVGDDLILEMMMENTDGRLERPLTPIDREGRNNLQL
jgi:hypothetical protein